MKKILRTGPAVVIVAAIMFLAGNHLQSLYGFDPPYAYFYAGLLLTWSGIALVGSFTVVLLGNFLLRKSRKP